MTTCSVQKIDVELMPELEQEAGTTPFNGVLKLEKVDESGTLVTGNINGIIPGTYGLQVLQFDDIRD